VINRQERPAEIKGEDNEEKKGPAMDVDEPLDNKGSDEENIEDKDDEPTSKKVFDSPLGMVKSKDHLGSEGPTSSLLIEGTKSNN